MVREISRFSNENKYHAGFFLLDPTTGKVLANYQGNKYFTPASNTKLLTLYATKKFLADPLPMFYVRQTDSVTYLWPTGNPGFLNAEIGDTLNYDILSKADSLVLSYPNFVDERMGSGWAWDDYNSSYSPEISAFPIYSNLATFVKDSLSNHVTIVPHLLKDSVTYLEGERFGVERAYDHNWFRITLGECGDCERQRPFRLSPEMMAALFADTLNVPVAIDTLRRPEDAKILYGSPQDSVVKVMMQHSDNFLAEQLLLQAGAVLTDTLDSSIAIDTIRTYLDAFLPDSVIWVDGSGLSRYNMTTPRNIVYLWQQLIRMYGEERLRQLLATGGKYGTIEHWYAADPPFIYGKTGTLRHNHVLSGLLITKKGKTLLFAYMHNHYQTSSSVVKEEMERVLHMIYEKY